MAPSAPVTVRLLGPLQVRRGDEAVALPPSQKTKALLAYLAVTGRRHTRERLCRMFWPDTDDPRGGLRWSLSKLRVLDDPDAKRIAADREGVAFDPRGARVDARTVAEALTGAAAALDVERLTELATLMRGEFLEGLHLDDLDEFSAWRVAQRERFRSHRIEVLRALVDKRRSTPDEAVEPARELVRLDPDDDAARANLVQLLAASGHHEEASEHYTLGRRHLERSGLSSDRLRRAWQHARNAKPASPQGVVPQEIRFCTAPDGVRLAYATVGAGPTLVKTANWMTHLEHDWRSPLWRHLARDLSRDHRLLRYDQRGNGLSDWDVTDFSLEACVGDLEAVVDAAAPGRFPLLGISQGCRTAIAYTARHPDRVSHLILYGGSARGWKHRPDAHRRPRSVLQPLIAEGWGRDNPAFRQVFTTLFMPEAGPEAMQWFDELQRVSTSPENAAAITDAAADVDVTGLLGEIDVPTLVMHVTEDAMVPFEESRVLAGGIAGARFVALEGRNHLLLDDEPAFARFLAEIRAFVGSD